MQRDRALHLWFYLKIKTKSPQLIICFPHFMLWFGGNNPGESGISGFFSLALICGSAGASQFGDVGGKLEMGMYIV